VTGRVEVFMHRVPSTGDVVPSARRDAEIVPDEFLSKRRDEPPQTRNIVNNV